MVEVGVEVESKLSPGAINAITPNEPIILEVEAQGYMHVPVQRDMYTP